MNKSELIQSLANKLNVPVEDAALIVDTFFESMREALLRGDRIEIRGFGSFKIKQYEGYTGRNPKTDESREIICISTKLILHFFNGFLII